MGLKVSDFDVNVLKNKTVVDYCFSRGSEYTLTLEDNRTGEITRVRIPAALANALENFSNIEHKKSWKTAA